MQRHKFARAFKFGSFFILMLFTVLLTGTLYAAPKVGSVTPENSIIGQNAGDYIGGGGVYSLPNGNIVIVSPQWNSVGAVTCLTPEEYKTGGIVISAANSLVGSKFGDQVGNDGITILSNGNYVVSSNNWDNGAAQDAGAVTWVNGTSCIPYGASSRGAIVSQSNSLVGVRVYGYQWGYQSSGIIALTNGNYVVHDNSFDNGAVLNVGAVVWADGSIGIAGEVSPANALIGTQAGDSISSNGVNALSNGHYVVSSPNWDNDSISNAGASTWGDGFNGTIGTVSGANSLIGTTQDDAIGLGGITALSNGNYVVNSYMWDNAGLTDAGAITWGNGSIGTTGVVSASNSLVGSSANDTIGYGTYPLLDGWDNKQASLIALTNGNYVVGSPEWDNGSMTDVGAATWGNGATGTLGVVSPANSLIGASEFDHVGMFGLAALTNGNYVVSSPDFDRDGVTDVGAVTWGDGAVGTTGVVSSTNSLVGTSEYDFVGRNPYNYTSITALTNGHYIVSSPEWDNGTLSNAGAATWGNGTGGTIGVVSPANSLIGKDGDLVSIGGVTPLNNGNYVVNSPGWNNGTAWDAGAATWGNGEGGTVGLVSAANSLVGTFEDDRISDGGTTALTNSNYVVSSPAFDNGFFDYAGAATWGNGTSGTTGVVNSTNSLVGSANFEFVSESGIVTLSNGHYVINSPHWGNGTSAIIVGNGTGGSAGTFSAVNSLIGLNSGEFTASANITALPDGSFIAFSPGWDNGATKNVGLITWSEGTPLPPNSAPILAEVGNQTVDEGDSLTFDVNASDADEPAQTLTYSIDGAPDDATFDTSTGEFAWTPDEADGGHVFNVTVTATDNGQPTRSDSEAFTITVNEVNTAPVLAQIGNQTVDEGQTLTFDAEVTDSDLPMQTLTYSIDGTPEDATFDTSTGQFSWTADEADGGQVFNVTITVTDDGEPALSDSEAFTITVNDVNDAPVLTEIGNKTVDVGATLTFDAEVTDSDDPAQTLTYSIDGTPEDASFDTSTGEFSWTADEGDSGQTFNITVTVTDDGTPALSDSESFTITVIPVVVEETNYLPNPGFENAGTTNKTTAGWNGLGLTTNDKRVCDTETKTYALDGECAFRFQFNGAAKPTRTLQRSVNAANFAKNDTVELRGMVKANGLTAGAKLVLKVVYNNGKTEAVSVKLTADSYEYTPFVTPQLTLKRPAKKITAQIRAGSAKGTFLVDDMAVVKVAAPLTIEGSTPDSGLRGLD